MSLPAGNPIFNPPPKDLQRHWAYEKGRRAQSAPEALAQMRGTVLLPFQPGEHKCISMKVIDFRGNEGVRLRSLKKGQYR